MDPYAVLGVDRRASIEEIKRAYREQASKYHPDKYVGHELADLAQEKMKQINEAYDAIVREREGGSSAGQTRYGYGEPGGPNGPGGGGGSGAYATVRELISRGRLDEAEAMLTGQARDAEWYFLMGSIAYRRGWFDEADANWRNAVNMDPGNAEYQQAYRFSRREPGRGAYNGGGGGSMERDLCNCCSALICMDCLCDGCCR